MSFSYEASFRNKMNDYHIIPIGHRCTSAIACKNASLRKYSLPLDWVDTAFPIKIVKVLENEFHDFIPDVMNHCYRNKYNIEFPHFNKNKEIGIEEIKRRIDRFQTLLKDDIHKYFIFINEDYLYNLSFRDKDYNQTFLDDMYRIEAVLKKQNPNIKYNILYFDFVEHSIREGSHIIPIKIHSNNLFDTEECCKIFWEFRTFCGSILSEIFQTKQMVADIVFD